MRAKTKIWRGVLAAGALTLLVARGPASAASALEDPLMMAVRSGDVPAALAMLERGDDANLASPDGHTLLMFVVWHGYGPATHDMLRALLAHGARVNAQTPEGMTALMLACGRARRAAETVGLLLEAGADPNLKNKAGWAPLLYAAHSPDIPRLLLQKGADPNVPNSIGETPLLATVRQRNAEGVKVLLQSGADVRVANDSDGLSPLEIATKNGDEAIIRLLVQKGAKLRPAGQWRHYRNTRVRYRISYPVGGHVEGEDATVTLTEAPSVQIYLPKGNSSEPDGYYRVHIWVEPDSESLTLAEWLEKQNALEDGYLWVEEERVTLNGRDALKVRMFEGGDCLFFAARGVFGICLDELTEEPPQVEADESQRTFARMLRSFEPLP